MNVNFLKENGKAIIAKMLEDKGTLFTKTEDNSFELESLINLNRIPLVGQVAPIITVTKTMEKYGFANLIAEQGTGKTQMSYSSVALVQALNKNKGMKVAFMTSGSKHLKKMGDEAVKVLGEDKTTVKIIRNFKDVETITSDIVDEGKVIVYLISKDSAKLSYPTMKLKVSTCPHCKGKISPKDSICPNVQVNGGKGLHPKKDKNIPKEATACGFSLIVPKPMKNNKISIAEALTKSYSKNKKKIFDMLIVDEVHEMASGSSQQGKAYRDISFVSARTLIMTGTLSNGYSSSLFYILFGLMPKQMVKWGYTFNDLPKWIDHFGAKRSSSRVETAGRNNRGFKKIQELPIISGRIISKLAPFTVWLKMEDLNIKMPPISEIPIQVQVEEDLHNHISLFKRDLEDTLKYMEDKDAKRKRRGLLASLMFLQDNPYVEDYEVEFDVYKLLYTGELDTLPTNEELAEVGYESSNFFNDVDSETDLFEKITISKRFTPYTTSELTNKEAKLIETLKAEFMQGRNSLVYSIFNGKGGVNKRLNTILTEQFPDKVIKMLPDTIQSENIQSWIEENPSDILIASPIKLATGFDLVQFPSIIFYEFGYDIKMISQAARRSWRAVGQDKPVKVFYMAYTGIQSKALELVGQKMRAAAVVQGQEVSEDALSSIYDTNSIETELINALSQDIKEEKLNFESSMVSLDKVRPWDEFEKQYLVLKASKEEEEVMHHAKQSYSDEEIKNFKEGRLF